MTDLRDQLSRLLDNEPLAPYDIDGIVRSGRRARRRRNAALAAAGTVGVAGMAAAGLVPVLTSGGTPQSTVSLGTQPSSSPSPPAKKATCYIMIGAPSPSSPEVKKVISSGKVGSQPTITKVKGGPHGQKLVEVCAKGATPVDPRPNRHHGAQPPAGPPYSYTEDPQTISSRLGTHLQDRVTGFGLSISYVRAFSQETSTLDAGHPSYFDGNVDVHEPTGYADIGVQVRHEVTQQVPFTGDCTTAEHCTETTLPDGSVLRTGEVNAGQGDMILTAEVHRPDGVVVQAQESNYPFGPDAGSQPHGDQPLTLDQLESLAEDSAFTF